jgi:hypothetical protein
MLATSVCRLLLTSCFSVAAPIELPSSFLASTFNNIFLLLESKVVCDTRCVQNLQHPLKFTFSVITGSFPFVNHNTFCGLLWSLVAGVLRSLVVASEGRRFLNSASE